MSEAETYKAAVVLLHLPRPLAGTVVEGLEPKQAASVNRSLPEARGKSSQEQRAVLREFVALGKRGSATYPFEFLQHVDRQTLLPFLVNERSATIALVLAHVSRGMASALIADLPAEMQFEVLRDLAGIRNIDPAVAEDVAEVLKRQISAALGETWHQPQPHGGVPVHDLWRLMRTAKAG